MRSAILLSVLLFCSIANPQTNSQSKAPATQPVTHYVGDRIGYTLRPAISIKQKDWEKKRASMQDVCSNCHVTGWVENFYKQYDGTIDLYNEKFAKPAKSIMDKLYAANKITKTPFDDKIEWTY